MTVANQDVGFDPANPVVLGDTILIAADVVTDNPSTLIGAQSATYGIFEKDPTRNSGPALLSKTLGVGITMAPVVVTDPDSPDLGKTAVRVTIRIDREEQYSASLTAPTDYYHELFTLSSDGLYSRDFTGRLRLTLGAL